MDALRRKIGMAADPAAGQGRGAAALWPAELARAAGCLPGGGLDLQAEDLVAGMAPCLRAGLAEVLERLPERGLFVLLSGPRGAGGVIGLDPEVLAGLIERQTLGRVTSRPVTPRRPTPTDAALATGLIDSALARLDSALAAEDDRVWAAGFRCSGHVEDPRRLGLLLEDEEYRVLPLTLAVAGGLRRGRVVLALPAQGRGEAPVHAAASAQALAAARFRSGLSEAVMGAPVLLDAVIARVVLPLGQAMALAPGETLRLGPAAVDRIDLTGPDGRRVAGGRLGQTRGLRALRLDDAAMPAPRAEGGLASGLAWVEARMRATGTG